MFPFWSLLALGSYFYSLQYSAYESKTYCTVLGLSEISVDQASSVRLLGVSGDLRMVRMLVEEFKAEVNHATITDSTPLRPACFDGFLEVVEYLVSKGEIFSVSPDKAGVHLWQWVQA